MICHTARRLICRSLNGGLNERQRRALASHVRSCERCGALLTEREAVHDLLRSAGLEDVDVPAGLPGRIKHAVCRAQEDAQIGLTPRPPAVGSPAFVATCASLFIGAVMVYVVTTQVYMKSMDAEMSGTPEVGISIASYGSAGTTLVKSAAPATSEQFDTAPAATRPSTATSASHDLARPPVWTATVGATGRREAPSGADDRGAIQVVAVSDGRSGARGEGGRPIRADIPRVARPDSGRRGHEVATPRDSADEASGEPAPQYAMASIRSLPMDGPVERASYGALRLASGTGAEMAAAHEASVDVAAGLAALYVVEKYVAEKVIQSESTLLTVTTSVPSSRQTAISDGTMR